MRTAVIASPVQTQSGYGHHAREIITNLIEQRGSEWDIKLLSLPWGHTPMTYPISEDFQNRLIPLPLTEQPDIWVQITVPTEFQQIGKYNIGVTAGTEGDVCPPEWIDRLNTMQLVIVPSEFTKKVFIDTAEKSGKEIIANIEVIPEYFDETIYSNKAESAVKSSEMMSILNDIPETFAFLTVGHWLSGQLGEDRKNIGGVVHSFFNCYKNTKNAPALILKTSGATYSILDRHEIELKINQIRGAYGTAKLPNVYILHGNLTDDEMNALYNHPKVKAMVSFTKAEGFGRPLLEFATTGKPIISPYYSGPVDFLKYEYICAIPHALTPIHPSAQNEFLIDGAKWATVDYGYAAKMFEEVHKNYKKWVEFGKRQRYFVNSNFTKTAVSSIYTNVLDSINDVINLIPKKVELKLPTLKKIDPPKLETVGE